MSIPLVDKGIVATQRLIKQEKLDGWLLYHYNDLNSHAMKILGINSGEVSRQTFYFIPSIGNSIKIVHDVEKHVLDHLQGDKCSYCGQDELKVLLTRLVGGKRIAIEYSQDIPSFSRVDGAVVDMLRELHVEIASSSNLIVELFSKLTIKQLDQQKSASELLDKIQLDAAAYAMKNLEKGFYEKDLQEYILNRMDTSDLLTVGVPICAVGRNSSFPHYTVEGRGAKLEKNKVLMIDAWGRLNEKDSVYSDLTKMFYLGKDTDSLLSERYAIVYEATQRCISLVQSRMKEKKLLRGFEVDLETINYFKEKNQLKYCCHRTGHCINERVHGDFGANLDCLEMKDTRLVTNNACYSIEPSLYFSEYGIRLESNIAIDDSGNIEVRGGSKPSIITWSDLI